MIEQDIIDKMKLRYEGVHPLIFHRSVERASSAGELFDILEELPENLPVIWDDLAHRWTYTDDLAQSHRFEIPTEEDDE